eukprot:TRINITY_DN2910_c0_g1_i6.p2 TRINITY_DN2910_c0_g1~~TRINITY_DN2910_c0_g1_i6.p2  ORF type:complete len:199 (-),score=20.13 TRINITY_DN2910_c0_g1_i6:146-742(-)
MCIRDRIYAECDSLDVSMVINNAGVMQVGLEEEYNQQDRINMIQTNCIHYVLLTQHFVEKFQKRQNKSAFIYVSSAISDFMASSTGVYGATKIFNEYWSDYVYYEYGNNKQIDVYCLKPGYVNTNLSQGRVEPLKVGITAKACVNAALRQLGHTKKSYGHISHQIIDILGTFSTHYITMKITKFLADRFLQKPKQKST